MIHKKPMYFGEIYLSQAVMKWMDEKNVEEAVLHIYQLEVLKKGEEKSIPYCMIFEVHSPQYLTKDWLQALYEKKYFEFSIPSQKITDVLLRLSLFIQGFPFPFEYENSKKDQFHSLCE
jgi:hypothetical protein